MQRDDFVGREAGDLGDILQVGAVFAAVADGHVDLAAGGVVGRDAVGQQRFDALGQVGVGGAVAQAIGPVMHRHRQGINGRRY